MAGATAAEVRRDLGRGVGDLREFGAVPAVGVLVTIVLTVPALMIGLIAPFAGMIVDAVDRKRLLLATMVGYAIFASRVGVGICEAAIMTCCTTLIGDYWSGARRGKYLGLQVLVAALSATVALAVGGALGANGWRTPFWVYAVAILLVLPMARLLWQPERPVGEAVVTGRRLEPLPWRRLAGPWLLTLLGGRAVLLADRRAVVRADRPGHHLDGHDRSRRGGHVARHGRGHRRLRAGVGPWPPGDPAGRVRPHRGGPGRRLAHRVGRRRRGGRP